MSEKSIKLKESLTQNWRSRLLDAFLILFASFFLYSVQRRDAYSIDLQKQIQSKASVSFVVAQDSALSEKFDLKLNSYNTQIQLILKNQEASRQENLSNFQEIRNQLYKTRK